MSRGGVPLDAWHLTRFSHALMKLLPLRLLNALMERTLNRKYDHRLYGLQPKHRYARRLRPLPMTFDRLIL